MSEEIVDIVDENDKVIATMGKNEAREKKFRYRAAKAIIIDRNGEFLIQKRSADRKNYPSMWDTGVAEIVKAGEDYESAIVRGLDEELVIKYVGPVELKLLFKFVFTGEQTKRIYGVFKFTAKTRNLQFNKEEISEIRFVTKKELQEMLEKEKFSPSAKPI